MNANLVSFDDVWHRVQKVLGEGEGLPDDVRPLYLVRDLFGKVRISVPDTAKADDAGGQALQSLAVRLYEALAPHCYPPQEAVLFVSQPLLDSLKQTAKEFDGFPGIYRADRLMTGGDWWTVSGAQNNSGAKRCTLFAVKGGVGRSTTGAVLAWHLARRGERVLVMDLDLESPGLSSALLEPERRPQFGVTDWFVEDLVGQGDHVVGDMLAAPAWVQEFEGDVRVVPAHGAAPGDYLAKLGRVYMDKMDVPWTKRLEGLLSNLETIFRPTFVLLESRSGLHDIAAATVTDLDAEVLLFAIDSESTWTDYEILFRHWNAQGLAERIRERLSVVSALTPVTDREAYLRRFRPRAWDLFREYLYDELGVTNNSDDFSFDLDETDAPHNPMEIDWAVGFAAGGSLRGLDETTVSSGYARFLKAFEERVYSGRSGDSQ